MLICGLRYSMHSRVMRHDAGWPRSKRCIVMATLAFAPVVVGAQELEPRAYSNAPIGFNFLITGYAHSQGGLSTDPSLPVDDANLQIDTGILAYVRSLDLWGKSGKFDVIVPYARLDGSALVAGQPAQRDVSGLADPSFLLSINFYGAPALSVQEFAAYQQDLVVGASVQVTAPVGQYDSSKLVNLGTNRWSVKPDLGLSKSFGAFILDFTGAVTFYSDNTDFVGGQLREQDPIYSVQTNLSYTFSRGAWASLGITYYRGGQTTVNGVRKDDELSNSRTGAVLALPLNRHNSIKFNISSGIITRTGTSFDTLGVAWQYRWADGF